MRSNYLFRVFIAFLFFTGTPLCGQSLNDQIYKSYVTGDMAAWYSVMEEMEEIWELTQSYEMLYDLTLAQYGYTAYCLSVHQKEKAKVLVLEAEKNAQRMLAKDAEWARAHALMGAIYGFRVGMEPYKVFRYANKSFEENRLAFHLAPSDPQIWMERGNIELYKPSIFGGDKKDAVAFYNKAIDLYEDNPAQLQNNWLYLNTLVGLASAYTKTENIGKANDTYLKLLRVEPNLLWIRDVEYPDFLKKYADKLKKVPEHDR